MRIRWNPKEVMDATVELEGHINKIIKPLMKAKAAAEEARGIPRLPDYVKYRFNAFVSEVERAIGGEERTNWRDGSKYLSEGAIQSRISGIRQEVPKDALKEAMEQPELFKRAA